MPTSRQLGDKRWEWEAKYSRDDGVEVGVYKYTHHDSHNEKDALKEYIMFNVTLPSDKIASLKGSHTLAIELRNAVYEKHPETHPHMLKSKESKTNVAIRYHNEEERVDVLDILKTKLTALGFDETPRTQLPAGNVPPPQTATPAK